MNLTKCGTILLATILSNKKFLRVVKHNKKQKLYFSYLMISLNIGLNISNLCINYERINDEITLLKHSITMDNSFSDDDSLSMATTPEAATNLIMEAFEKNPLINGNDLEVAFSLENYIKDNPYFDYEELYNTFSTLNIIYSKNYYSVDHAAATYSSFFNRITMYKSSYYKNDSEAYEDILQHEMIHSTGNLDNTLLNESMTSLLQLEYSNDITVNDAYYDHILFAKIFCELITPEKC